MLKLPPLLVELRSNKEENAWLCLHNASWEVPELFGPPKILPQLRKCQWSSTLCCVYTSLKGGLRWTHTQQLQSCRKHYLIGPPTLCFSKKLTWCLHHSCYSNAEQDKNKMIIRSSCIYTLANILLILFATYGTTIGIWFKAAKIIS